MRLLLALLFLCASSGSILGQQLDARAKPSTSVEAVFFYREMMGMAVPVFRAIDRDVATRLSPFLCPEMNAAVDVYVEALAQIYGSEKAGVRGTFCGNCCEKRACTRPLRTTL